MVVDQVGLDGDAEVAHRIVDPGQQLESGASPGQTPPHLGLRFGVAGLPVDLGVHVAPVGRGLPVDGRQEVEVGHGASIPERPGGVHPGSCVDPRPHVDPGGHVVLD